MQKILLAEPEKCTGCRLCEMYCSLTKTATCNPLRARVNVIKWEEENIIVPVICHHCQEPLCALTCPVNAITKDKETGLVATDPNLCIHCQMCMVACPFSAPSLDHIEGKVVRCDLCSGEEDGPICVQVCSTGALRLERADRLGRIKKRESLKKLTNVMMKYEEIIPTGSK